MASRTPTVAGRALLGRPAVRWLLVLAWFEALAVVGYLALTGATVQSVRYVLYPFVWINVGVLAVLRVSPPSAGRRTRLAAGGVAALYFLALAALSGLVGLELGGHTHAHVHGLQVTMAAPGWGPRVGYAGSLVTLNFVPYRVVGYLAVTYLVYAALLDAAEAAVTGLLGVGSCIGCAFSLAAGAAGVAGGTGGVAAALAAFSVDLSTLAYVAAVALLVVRPGFDA